MSMLGGPDLDGPVFLHPTTGGKPAGGDDTRSLLDAHRQSLVDCVESAASRQERILQRLESKFDQLYIRRSRPSPRLRKAKTRDLTVDSRPRSPRVGGSIDDLTAEGNDAESSTYGRCSSAGLDSASPGTPRFGSLENALPDTPRAPLSTFNTNENLNSVGSDGGHSQQLAGSRSRTELVGRTLSSLGDRDEYYYDERPRFSLDSLKELVDTGRANSRLIRNETRWKGQGESALPMMRTSKMNEMWGDWRKKGLGASLLSMMLNMVHSGTLDGITGAIIVIDTVVIGIEADYIARNGTTTKTFFFLSVAFTTGYIMELVLRVCASGCQYLHGPDWRWNLFDILIVFISLFDLVAQMIQSSGGPLSRTLRIIRILRVARDFRLVRMLRNVREFRKMVFALAYSLHTLFWSLLLFMSLIFVFGTVFTQVTTDYFLINHQGEYTIEDEDLKNSFGNMEASMFSLYAAITSGRNWGELATLLQKIHWGVMLVFITYLSISFFGVMNIVTAVFVESAMHSSKHYKDLLVQEKSLDDATNVKHMKEIFALMDANCDGHISMNEMRRFLMNEGKDLQRYFQALEISATDTVTLFELLDRDRSGEIDIDEFCEGCIRLRGTAKSFDINTLLHEQRRLREHLDRFLTHISKRLNIVRETLQKNSDDEVDYTHSDVVTSVV